MKHLLIVLCAVLSMGLYSCSSQEEPLQPANEQAETTLYADHITPDEACRKAAEAMNHHFGKDLPKSRAMSGATARLYGGSRSGEANLYVVEYDEGGFAVVNANRDAKIDVFAVVPEGTFNTIENPGLEFYMNYADERAGGGIEIRPDPVLPMVPAKKLVSRDQSLRCEIPFKWERGMPYNYENRETPTSNPLDIQSGPMSIAMIVGYGATKLPFDDGKDYLWFSNDYYNLKEISKTIAIRDVEQNLLNEGERDLQRFLGTLSLMRRMPAVIPDYETFNDRFEKTYGLLFEKDFKFLATASHNTLKGSLSSDKPILMYGQTSETSSSLNDLWIIEQSKWEHYVENHSAIDQFGQPTGPDTHTYEEWIYVNWALGGSGKENGWFMLCDDMSLGYKNTVIVDDEITDVGPTYRYNFHFITNLKIDIKELESIDKI